MTDTDPGMNYFESMYGRCARMDCRGKCRCLRRAALSGVPANLHACKWYYPSLARNWEELGVEQERAHYDRLFAPICAGLTHHKIRAISRLHSDEPEVRNK